MGKRTDVPLAWKGKPEEWWRHVRECPFCTLYFESPLPKELVPDSLTTSTEGKSLQDQEV